jgi:hypothetical protein
MGLPLRLVDGHRLDRAMQNVSELCLALQANLLDTQVQYYYEILLASL